MPQVSGIPNQHYVLRYTAAPATRSASTQTDFSHLIQQPAQTPRANWHERALKLVDRSEALVNDYFPDLKIQTKLDRLGAMIEAKLSFPKLNAWLNKECHGNWQKQLAHFLVRLPLRVARNIINLLYSIIKLSLQAIVHPLQTLHKLARLLINLVQELSKPETWTVLGAGLIGTSFGQAAISLNPLSLIGMIVGACFMIGGLSAGAIKAVIEDKTGDKFEAMRENFLYQMKKVPEAMLTGFIMGLIFGAIQRAAQTHKVNKPITSQQEAAEWAQKKIAHKGLPQPAHVGIDRYGNVWMDWKGSSNLAKVRAIYPGRGDGSSLWFDTQNPINYSIWESKAATSICPFLGAAASHQTN